MRLGSWWSEGRVTWPVVGPEALSRALELEGRDHVGVAAEAVLLAQPGVEYLEAGGKHDRAYLYLFKALVVVVVDRFGLAGQFALAALGAHAAAEAALRLGQRLGLGVAQGDLAKVVNALGRRTLWHRRAPRALNLAHQLAGRQLGDRHLRGGGAQYLRTADFLALEVTINGCSGRVAAGDGLDDEADARYQVAAGKDARPARGQRVRVDADGAAAGDFHPLGALEEGRLGALADGKDDRVASENVLAAFGHLEVQPAVGLEAHKGDPLALHARDAAVLLQYAEEGAVVMDVDALGLSLFDLPGVGRHRLAALQAGHLDPLGAEAKGGLGGVDGDVSAAEHEHVLAHRDLLAEANLAKEVRGDQHAR